MAKKKQDLTPEERLAAALVPEEEWPYALPDGWKWVRLLGGAATCMDNKRKPVNSKERANRIGEIPYYGATGQVGWIDEYLTNEELILLGEDGAPFLDILKTKAYIINGKSWVNNHAHILKSFMGHIGNLYLMYYLNNFDYRKYVSGTTRLKLTQGKMKNIPVPYPPLSEQHRLVARIESLFAKLDAAREKVQSVLDSHETRKAALLHDAFTGKLTARWQEEHNLSYNEWHLVCIKDICHSLKYGTAKKSEASGRYVVIRMGNLFDGEILWDNLAYSNDSEDIEKYQLTPGDVLFNRTNSAALVGKTSIYRGDYPAIYAGYIIKLDYDRQAIDGEFLNYVMNSPCAKAYCNKVKTDGVNQSNINAKKIGAFQFKLPSLPEQQEIVRILGRLLAREQRARQAAEETLAAIDRMKQSILARAFRGEL